MKKYFKDKTNTVIIIILLTVCIYTVIVRFNNIGMLSYWGDDGQTFLGTSGILNYGYPKLPSGNIFYHLIFHFYLRVIPSLAVGINEAALRFPSAFFGALVVPLIFIFIKDLVNNKYIALLVSLVVALNAWQIELSREVIYYSEYQFFYLLSIYLFYRGFFKEEKKFKIASIIFIFFTIILNEPGISLILLFFPLLIYKKFKGFFKKDIIISFFIMVIMIIGRVVYGELFLKTDSVNMGQGIIDLVKLILSRYSSDYTPFYHRIFNVLFPEMYYIVFFGVILVILYLFIPGIRNNEENYINIYSNSKYSIKLPFSLTFLYFIFYSNTVFNGLGNLVNQQRYIYHVNPIFIAIYCYIIFDIGRLVSNVFNNSMIDGNEIKYLKNNKTKIPGKDIIKSRYPSYLINSVYFITAAIIFFLTVNWVNPIENFKITLRSNGDPVASEFAPDNTFLSHHDVKTPGQYIYEHKKDGDIVIAAELLNSYGYTGQIDYWLWTTDLENGQFYVYDKDGKIYDEYFGVQVIRDLYQLFKVLNNNSNKNIWLIASNPADVPDNIAPDVSEFIKSKEQYKIITGKGGLYSAYLFPKNNQPTRGFFFTPAPEHILNIEVFDNNPFVISFGNKENQPYLKYGWSDMESNGTWAVGEYSALFMNIEEKQNYTIAIEAMAFFDPEKKQEMKIILNGTEIGNITFKDSNIGQYAFEIKTNLIKVDSYNTLEFNYKYQFNPKSLGISSDSRDLSVYFGKIAIQENIN